MSFEWPLALAALLIVPLVALGYWQAIRRRSRYAVRFSNLELLGRVAATLPNRRRHLPAVLFLGSLALLAGSLARPYLPLMVPIKQTIVMLVIDVSRSMEARDLQPTRLEAAKAAARDFVQALPPDAQLGLVSFSDSASLLVPPTTDRPRVLAAVGRLEVQGSTAIGEGILAALHAVPATAATAGAGPAATVVLLSDGASNRGTSPTEAARRAHDRSVRVFTIGIGTREGGTVDYLGQRLRVGLDERTLRRIATMTDAEYSYAADAGQLRDVYRDLGGIIGWEPQRTEATALLLGAGALLSVFSWALSLLWGGRLP